MHEEAGCTPSSQSIAVNGMPVEHLSLVKCERSLYQADVQKAKELLECHPSGTSQGLNSPNAHTVAAHYSFYHAQQITFATVLNRLDHFIFWCHTKLPYLVWPVNL